MQMLGDKQRDIRGFVAVFEAPIHIEFGSQGSKCGAALSLVEVESARCVIQGELDAHEEEAKLVVLMLVGVQDIGVMLEQEIGDGRDNSFAVGAIDEQDSGLHKAWWMSGIDIPLV